MKSTRSNIIYLLIVCLVIFQLQSCNKSVTSECNIVLPDFKIVNKFCSSEYQIVFGKREASNGNWPYVYKWSDGSESLNNLNIESSGTYNLTVTDSDGCSRVEVYDVKDELKVPRIKSANVTEVLCEQASALIEIEYFLPVFEPDYYSGFTIEYWNPDGKGIMVFTEMRIPESGFGKKKFIGIPLSDRPFKVTAFTRIIETTVECQGESIHLDLPSVELPEEYFDTWIEIRKKDPKDCAPSGDFILEGYCGSPKGCFISGNPPLSSPLVPFGMFEFDLPFFVGTRSYAILPQLESDIQCNEFEFFDNNYTALNIANIDSSLINMAGKYWSFGEDCNCFMLELKNCFDSPVTIFNADIPSNGSTVTQIGDFSAKVCIEKDGHHCVLVRDQNGCETKFCNLDLKNRNIDFSTISTFHENSFVHNSGNFFAKVNSNAVLPVTWDVGDLDRFISSVNDSFLHLSSLELGEYSISVSDAKGCNEVIDFVIDDCKLLGFVRDIGIYEFISSPMDIHPRNTRLISASPIIKQFDIEPYNVDKYLVQKAIKELSTYKWTGPGEFTSHDQSVFPIETGRYCVQLRTICGKMFKACHDFVAVVE